jgi:hypothetical protein
MSNNLTLAPNFSIPAVDYAGQGNAILGIRDAGKTYTAMKAAEELLENKIPIIVYDPVGIWKNLKVGTGKHKGFPVVVAGGEGSDIRLTINNAVDIVRAAMKENVSLVIDLYAPELINKSTWIRIVQETVDLLMYENKPCGLRHIFIEEAAEFIPQRLQPQHSKVYASLERLARMGRNARLGYTLINQRAEEVNKAILEISAFSLLHKQVGKNSLKSIQTWMELLQVENAKEIIHSLPSLKQGECWVIGMNTKPHRIKVSERKTFHPDPKQTSKEQPASTVKIDVSSFVEKLNKQLEKQKPPSQKEVPKVKAGESRQDNGQSRQAEIFFEKLKQENQQLRDEIKWRRNREAQLIHQITQYTVILKSIRTTLDKEPNSEMVSESYTPRKTSDKSPDKKQPILSKPVAHVTSRPINAGEKLAKCPLAILQFLASFPDRWFTKAQAGIATGYSPGSGGFNNALSELTTKGLISRADGKLQAADGDLSPWIGDHQPQRYSIDTYKDKLAKCEREIYQVLLDHPRQQFTKEQLADLTESKYSHSSGGFNNSLSTLTTLELIKRDRGLIQLNPELLEI